MVHESLIDRCIREESRAQYELYQILYSQMMSVCTRYERNKQDALARMNLGFFKILTQLKQRRPEVPFELWVRRVMINTVIDEFRKDRSRKAHEELTLTHDEIESGEMNYYLHEMEAEAFAELLQNVPDMSRHVFNLFAVDGYTHREIAEMTGITEGTSKWHVSHARKVLQQAIAQIASIKMLQTQNR